MSPATGLDLRARVTRGGAVTFTVTDQAAAKALAVKLGAPESALEEAPPFFGTGATGRAPIVTARAICHPFRQLEPVRPQRH